MGYQRIKGSRTFYSLDVRLRNCGPGILGFPSGPPAKYSLGLWGKEKDEEWRACKVTNPEGKSSSTRKPRARAWVLWGQRLPPRRSKRQSHACAETSSSANSFEWVLLLGLRWLAHENTLPGVKRKTQEFSIFSLANNYPQEQRTGTAPIHDFPNWLFCVIMKIKCWFSHSEGNETLPCSEFSHICKALHLQVCCKH